MFLCMNHLRKILTNEILFVNKNLTACFDSSKSVVCARVLFVNRFNIILLIGCFLTAFVNYSPKIFSI